MVMNIWRVRNVFSEGTETEDEIRSALNINTASNNEEDIDTRKEQIIGCLYLFQNKGPNVSTVVKCGRGVVICHDRRVILLKQFMELVFAKGMSLC